MDMLHTIDIDGKDLRLLRNLYWNQTAAVRVDNELSGWAKIQHGVRQGCVLSPDLFSVYSETILCYLNDCSSILMDGRLLNNI